MTPVLLGAGDPRLRPNPERAAAWGHVASLRRPELADDRGRALDLLVTHPGALERTCRPGHFTGSALVVDPASRRILLLLHTKLQRWLQPGGHADGDGNLAAVAAREAWEETGIDGLQVVLPAIDLDIHEVAPPAEDPHLHLDVRFLVVAPAHAQIRGNHESEAIRWVDPGDVTAYDLDAGTHRLIARGLAVLDAL